MDIIDSSAPALHAAHQPAARATAYPHWPTPWGPNLGPYAPLRIALWLPYGCLMARLWFAYALLTPPFRLRKRRPAKDDFH